jgi:Flp pilus assembly pilin Flp
MNGSLTEVVAPSSRGEIGMESVFHRLIREQQGQDLIEYALLASLLAVACITGILELTRIVEFFEAVGVILQNAI